MPPTSAPAAGEKGPCPTATPTATATERAPPGALACQRDSSLRSLRARVVSCARVSQPASKAGGPAHEFLEVELLDTVLFPEGGGQPSDTGALDGVRVDKVFLRDGRCLHRVPLTPGENAGGENAGGEGAAQTLREGQEVLATVDWARRFDHMQQHSAQHLLSAIAERHGLETTTWSLGDERCNVELVPAATGGQGAQQARAVVPADVLRRIEQEANAAIVRGLAMAPTFARPGTPEWERVARKFPADAQPEALRIVCIDGLDANPCCGTHVQSLAQLQALRLLHVEFARGATRVWFVAGERVNREFSRMFQREQRLTKVLSCAPDEHAARAEKLLQAQRSASKEAKALQKELAGFLAAELRAKAAAAAPGTVVVYHRKEPGADLAFLQALLALLADAARASVFVLAASDARGRDGAFVLAGPPAFVAAHGRAVLPAIEGKGGGGKNNGVLQGKAADLRGLDALAAELERRLGSEQ